MIYDNEQDKRMAGENGQQNGDAEGQGQESPHKVGETWDDVINAARLAAAKKKRANKGPEYPERALLCLSLKNPIRRLAIYIAESRYVSMGVFSKRIIIC